MPAKIPSLRPEPPCCPIEITMTKLHEPYWIIPGHAGLEIYVAELGHIVLRQRNLVGKDLSISVQQCDVMVLCDQLVAAAAEASRLETLMLSNHCRQSSNP